MDDWTKSGKREKWPDLLFFFPRSNKWFCLVGNISPCSTFLPLVYLAAHCKARTDIDFKFVRDSNTNSVESFASIFPEEKSSWGYNTYLILLSLRRWGRRPSGQTSLRQTSAHTWDEAHCLSFHGRRRAKSDPPPRLAGIRRERSCETWKVQLRKGVVKDYKILVELIGQEKRICSKVSFYFDEIL